MSVYSQSLNREKTVFALNFACDISGHGGVYTNNPITAPALMRTAFENPLVTYAGFTPKFSDELSQNIIQSTCAITM